MLTVEPIPGGRPRGPAAVCRLVAAHASFADFHVAVVLPGPDSGLLLLAETGEIEELCAAARALGCAEGVGLVLSADASDGTGDLLLKLASDLMDLLVVQGDRYRSLVCLSAECCPPEGIAWRS
ncbi:MAG: hypothetical protein ACT4QG_09090 [Sporichthyaceae bacterium]